MRWEAIVALVTAVEFCVLLIVPGFCGLFQVWWGSAQPLFGGKGQQISNPVFKQGKTKISFTNEATQSLL